MFTLIALGKLIISIVYISSLIIAYCVIYILFQISYTIGVAPRLLKRYSLYKNCCRLQANDWVKFKFDLVTFIKFRVQPLLQIIITMCICIMMFKYVGML